MNSRLNRIKDWAALAKAARYSVTALAHRCDVSPRQLERFFLTRMEKSPHVWLHELRMQRAIELILDATPPKRIAQELCYKDTAYFAHSLKKHFGVTPGQHSRKFD